MRTRTIQIENAEQLNRAVEEAAAVLIAGEVVGVPTETVYGLAANALNAAAVQKIYEIKGRPAQNPLIVHVASLQMARSCVADWPPEAERLASKFWPGPLTLILPKNPNIPAIVTAGGATVGIRWPAHPFMQALIRRCQFPLAAPSANLANHISPTTAAHVEHDLGGKIELIVDGGSSAVGIESTVLDLSGNSPRILRPGMISSSQISEEMGLDLNMPSSAEASATVLKSPGQFRRHYAPQAKLLVIQWKNERDLGAQAQRLGMPMESVHVIAHEIIPSLSQSFGRVAVIPHDPEAFARALYAELHRCDELSAKIILVEAPPELPEWEGIRDRLRRAAAE